MPLPTTCNCVNCQDIRRLETTEQLLVRLDRLVSQCMTAVATIASQDKPASQPKIHIPEWMAKDPGCLEMVKNTIRSASLMASREIFEDGFLIERNARVIEGIMFKELGL